MAETNPDSALLERWARRFTRAFNDNDLDAVMGWFANDAVYDQFDDAQAKGRDEIRKAFEPQFAGAFGNMQFDEEDLFVDPARRKVMISWLCRLETQQGAAGWRGLDLLHFDSDGRVTRKLTYAKAPVPKLGPVG
jgi:ketosteroid isomerase-like protein